MQQRTTQQVDIPLTVQTGEKPSFLMISVDCWSPTDASFVPVPEHIPVSVSDYRQRLMLSSPRKENWPNKLSGKHSTILKFIMTGNSHLMGN